MNFDDYESLPTTSITTNMTAGAIAGILEHCVMYPLDSVKTRMQSLSPVTSGYNITSTFMNMIRNEGIFRPIRGVSAVVAGAGPAHALYFGTYELTKEFLASITKYNQLNYLTSAVCATLLHDAVSNPTEVIKQRLQMYNSPYKTVLGCMMGVYKTEGIKAFYRSYSTQLVMNLPHQSIHFMTYEFFQNLLNVDRKYNPPVHVIAGGAAGAAASALTTPLDVIKTLLNTQEAGHTQGMGAAVRQIYKVAGPRGFYKGLSARVLYSMPATAICWSTYEFFKFYLCGLSRDQYKSSVSGKNTLHRNDTFAPKSQESQHYINNVPIDDRYVLPSTNVNQNDTKDKNIDSEVTKRESPPSITTTPVSPIKTVCELSTNVTNPTLNLNTRHSDVKSPFDRIH